MKPARIPPACTTSSASRCERLSTCGVHKAQHPAASSVSTRSLGLPRKLKTWVTSVCVCVRVASGGSSGRARVLLILSISGDGCVGRAPVFRSPPPSPSWSFAGAAWCMMQQREGVSTGDLGDALHAWSCMGSTWARGLVYAGCPGWHPEPPLSGRPSLTWRGARHPAPPRGPGQCRQPSRAQDRLRQVSQAGPV